MTLRKDLSFRPTLLGKYLYFLKNWNALLNTAVLTYQPLNINCYRWIQQAVFRSIAYHSRTIRLPVHVHNLLNRVRRVRAELKRLHGRAPTNEEMAAEMDMPVEKFVKMLRLTRKAISLDMAKYQNNPKDLGHESDTSLGDTIDASVVMKEESSPQHTVDRTLFRDDLKEMLKVSNRNVYFAPAFKQVSTFLNTIFL